MLCAIHRYTDVMFLIVKHQKNMSESKKMLTLVPGLVMLGLDLAGFFFFFSF